MTQNTGSGGSGWITALVIGALAFGGGLLIGLSVGKDSGRRDAENNAVTIRDANSFGDGRFECGPCDPEEIDYRYVSRDGNPNGKYWTPESPETLIDPVNGLALPPNNDASTVYATRHGPECLCCRGVAAPQDGWGRPGGAVQKAVIYGLVR